MNDEQNFKYSKLLFVIFLFFFSISMLKYSIFVTGNFILVYCAWVMNFSSCLRSFMQGDRLMAWKYSLDARNKKLTQLWWEKLPN
jgi:hypothetical protein